MVCALLEARGAGGDASWKQGLLHFPENHDVNEREGGEGQQMVEAISRGRSQAAQGQDPRSWDHCACSSHFREQPLHGCSGNHLISTELERPLGSPGLDRDAESLALGFFRVSGCGSGDLSL